jgi:hypothetical protein
MSFRVKRRNLKDFSPDPSNDGRGRNANVKVTLKVYDILGREIATLVNEHKQAGMYSVTFNARHLEQSREIPSGVYILHNKSKQLYRIEEDDAGKIIL